MALSEATLKRIDDPREREAMLGEAKVQLRRSSPDLARYMRLSADEEEALLSVMAENGLDGSTRFAQCSHDPKCDPSAVARAESDRNHQTLQAYLGPEKYERFAAYEETMAERRDVAQLKARLPADLSLRDASSERLIAGLADERRATVAAAERQGLHTDQFGISGGNLVTRSALDGADTKARLDSATQYSQRLRDRAAEVLTSRQLDVFDQMQDEVLTIMRERLRDEDALASVRKGQEH